MKMKACSEITKMWNSVQMVPAMTWPTGSSTPDSDSAAALTLTLNLERFNAGTVLKRAGLPSGGYAYLGATYRY
eukprot:gene36030-44439_t